MTPGRPHAAHPQLVRAIGRWSMVALAFNCMVGSGIFGLPAVVAGLLGSASPHAVLLAGLATAVIVACYAEVASQFAQTGGTYLYVRRAFGRLIGLQVGWIFLLARLTACAAAVNLLVAYLGEFWPGATQPLGRVAVIGIFVATLAAVNYRGVGSGAQVSNVAAIAKLAVLGLLCASGLAWLGLHPPVAAMPVHAGAHGWLQAMLLLVFLYGGYEAALNPMAEAQDPRRDVAFALFAALAALTVVYTLLQLIVVDVLPDAARSPRPLADAAGVLMGPSGAAFVAAGALISVYGYVGANMLTVPRSLFALGERGDLPALLAAVHERFRTPYVSIAVFALLLWLFSQFAGFSWNLTLSAAGRIFYYAATCAALPVLRRMQPDVPSWRVPGGLLLPVLGMGICATLLAGVDFSESAALVLTVGAGLVNWLVVRHRTEQGAAA